MTHSIDNTKIRRFEWSNMGKAYMNSLRACIFTLSHPVLCPVIHPLWLLGIIMTLQSVRYHIRVWCTMDQTGGHKTDPHYSCPLPWGYTASGRDPFIPTWQRKCLMGQHGQSMESFDYNSQHTTQNNVAFISVSEESISSQLHKIVNTLSKRLLFLFCCSYW